MLLSRCPRADRSAARVYVQPDHDHLHRLQAVGGYRRADRPHPRPKATPLSGHARRSRSAATTQRWKVRPTQSTFGIESAAADRALPATGHRHSGDDDIEFTNVPRSYAGNRWSLEGETP